MRIWPLVLSLNLLLSSFAFADCSVTIDGYCHLGAEVIDFAGVSSQPVSAPGQATEYYDTALNKLRCSQNGAAYTDCVGSGSGTPGGSNTQVQYNNSGAFGGASGFTFNNGTNGVGISGPLSISSGLAAPLTVDDTFTGGINKQITFKQSGVEFFYFGSQGTSPGLYFDPAFTFTIGTNSLSSGLNFDGATGTLYILETFIDIFNPAFYNCSHLTTDGSGYMGCGLGTLLTTTSSYIATTSTSVICGLTGGAPGTPSTAGENLTLGFDYTSDLATSGLAADTEVFGKSSIIFEGKTAGDGFQLSLSAATPSADRTVTIPDITGTIITNGDTGSVTGAMIADDTVQLTTDTAGNYVATVTTSTTTGLTGGAPGVVAGEGKALTIALDYTATTSTNLTARTEVFASNGIIFEGNTGGDNRQLFLTLGDPVSDITITIPVTSGTLVTTGDSGSVTGTMIANDTVALTTDTAGNYVATITTATTTGLNGGVSSEGAAATLAFDYTNTLAGSPAIAANGAIFGNNGIIFEGATADANEMMLSPADPTVDVVLTLPAHTGTVLVATCSLQTGANTACSTTCGTGTCVFGEDAGTVGVVNSQVVDCSDATADRCVCCK